MKKLLIALILIVACTLTLVACQDKPVAPVESVTITSLEELSAIGEMTGPEYEDTQFTLDTDLTISDYQPLFSSINAPFIGNFDGKNKTVNITVNTIPESGYVALFGCVRDATISNLNVNITLPDSVSLNQTINVIGGISALTMGEVTISNVNVSMTVAPKVSHTSTVIETYKDGSTNEEWHCDNVEYIGGIVGRAGGKLTVTNATVSSLDVTANSYISHKFTRYNEVYADSVFLGGIIGSVVEGASVTLNSSSVTSLISNVIAESVFLGGLVGDGSNVTIASGNSCTQAVVSATALTKGYVGGIAGYLKNSTITSTSTAIAFYGISPSSHLSLGGLIGYLDADIVDNNHLSIITDCTATVTAPDLYRVTNPLTSTVSYGIGYIKNSKEIGSILSGSIATSPTVTVPATWGDVYGVAYGSAVVQDTTLSMSNSIGVGQAINHVTYNDDGDVTSTITPRV